MIQKKQDETPEKSDHEALPDLWNDTHDLLEGDIFGGVNAGDGVDDCGGGEESENEEEGEVSEFEEPEGGPFGGDDVGEFGILSGSDLGFFQGAFIVENFEEEELGDLYVGEVDEREGEDESEGNLREDFFP